LKPRQTAPERTEQRLVLSYMSLRRAIGFIGIALPIVLVFGNLITAKPGTVLPTISDYYYSDWGGYFVGSLCAIAVFLASYHGYDRDDRIASAVSSASALLVALIPCGGHAVTMPDGTDRLSLWGWSATYSWSWAHYISAGTFLLSLAWFCHLFRSTGPEGTMTPQKIARNRVYAACGTVIIGCVAVLLASKASAFWLGQSGFLPQRGVLLLESFAVFAFGWSWAVKGEVLFGDKKLDREGQPLNPATAQQR
jgi:hypothetical protein